jgi:hypothetical protein
MPSYLLELANSTARLNCSCCNAGMTSVCGFISQDDQPYAVYYALLHNNRQDIFVRLSISVGEWWNHRNYEHRYALCLDLSPAASGWHTTVRDEVDSPQHNFAPFGQWLGPEAEIDNPRLHEIVAVANFVATHDPAVLTCLSGR